MAPDPSMQPDASSVVEKAAESNVLSTSASNSVPAVADSLVTAVLDGGNFHSTNEDQHLLGGQSNKESEDKVQFSKTHLSFLPKGIQVFRADLETTPSDIAFLEELRVGYTFLNSSELTFQQMRKICSSLKVRQDCNKGEMACRLFLLLVARIRETKTVDSILGNDKVSKYISFARKLRKEISENDFSSLKELPELGELLKKANCKKVGTGKGMKRKSAAKHGKVAKVRREVEKGLDDGDETGESDINDAALSDDDEEGSEAILARCLAILNEDSDVMSLFIDSNNVLDRKKLQLGLKSDRFWTTTMEEKFNSPEIDYEVDLSGVVSGVDTSKRLNKFVKGLDIKKKFWGFRNEMGKYYNWFGRSGQNDPTFAHFLARQGLSHKSPKGRRMLIGAEIFKVGEEGENVCMLNMVSREIDVKGGVGTEAGFGDMDLNRSQREHRSRSRRVSTSGSCEQSIARMCDVISTQVESGVRVVESKESMVRAVGRIKKELQGAEKDGDDEMVEYWQDALDDARARLRRLMRSSQKEVSL